MTGASPGGRTGASRVTSLLVFDAATPAATRRRHGRLAAGPVPAWLPSTASPSSRPCPAAHRDVQIVLTGLGALGAAVCFLFAPGSDCPAGRTRSHPCRQWLILSLGTGGMAGVLQHYIPLVAVLFAICRRHAGARLGSAHRRSDDVPGRSSPCCSAVSQQQQVEILGAIVALAAARRADGSRARARAYPASRPAAALHRPSLSCSPPPRPPTPPGRPRELAGQLLAADGAVMMLSEAPGSTTFSGVAGARPGSGLPCRAARRGRRDLGCGQVRARRENVSSSPTRRRRRRGTTLR